MAFQDGLSSFLSTWSGVHTAFSFNNTNANSGTDSTHDANSTIYSSASGYPNNALAATCSPDANGDMDIYTITDVCMLLYLPSSGYTENQNYGLFHNGGGTNAQAGWCRYKTGTGWQLCISHNASGSNQDETVYTLGATSGWFCIGFQFEDNSGNMALWVDGTNVSEVSRSYALLYGSGNPQIGDSNADHPLDDGGWGTEATINGTGILIANMVVDNPNSTNSSPPGNGDTFYTDFYSVHFAAAESSSVSPSVSPSASMSASISPSASPSTGYTEHTRGAYISLPTDDGNLSTTYSGGDITDVETDNGVRVGVTGTSEYIVHQFKNFVGSQTHCFLTWNGQSSEAPTASTVYLQIFNQNSVTWETVDSNSTASASIDFNLTASISDLTNYKDASDTISCRVYQLAS